MSPRASVLATLLAAFLLVLAACSPPAATPRPTADETEAAETEAAETEEPEDDEVSILALDEGDCFNLVDEDDKTAEVVDCDDEHEYEVYATVEIDEDELPDAAELEDLAGDCFGDVFADFVGVEYAASRWYTTPFIPSEDDWDDGHEVIVCALYDPEEEETEGSAEGSEAGQADETEEPQATEEPEGTGGGTPREELEARIPEEIRETCRLPAYGMRHAVVTLFCEPSEHVDYMYYGLFANADQLDAQLSVELSSVDDLDNLEGRCSEGEQALGSYSVGGSEESAGTLLCYFSELEAGTFATLVWTRDDALILVQATREDGDLQALYEWWSEGSGLTSD